MSDEIIYGIDPALEPSKTIMVVSTANGVDNRWRKMIELHREDFAKEYPFVMYDYQVSTAKQIEKEVGAFQKKLTITRDKLIREMEGALLSPWFIRREAPIRPLANILSFWDCNQEIDWRPNESIAEDYYV